MFQILILIIYFAFISLGLPDGLLGSAWPTMYIDLGVSVSDAGIVSMVIALGTVISALLSDKLTYRLGAGLVTAISVGMTCVALFGFSMSRSLIAVILWSIPYGLGAGSVDAALNNYVAVHYSAKHMSWLHCMWGIGASIGPYIMGYAVSSAKGWDTGYRYVGIIQIVLTFILFMSLPLWKKRKTISSDNASEPIRPLPLKDILKIPGVPAVLVTFFCYCALESTTGLWTSSFLRFTRDIDEGTAAFMATLFYSGITVGRAVNGFLTVKFSDTTLIRSGMTIVLCGILLVFLPFADIITFIGIVLIGVGCAPIYPCIIHSTPIRFGEDRSQSIVGVQMASAYIGTMLMPPIFGLIGENISMKLWPLFLLAVLVLMFVMHEKLIRQTN